MLARRSGRDMGRRNFRKAALSAAAVLATGVVLAACTPDPGSPPDVTTPAAPAITISDTTGLSAIGSTVTVTGTGFDPAKIDGTPGSPVGIYVALGRGASSSYPEAFSAAKFIRPAGPSPETAGGARLSADGTFSATISPTALFSASGNAVNCYIEACSIYVFSAHSGTYAPWTFTKTPVTFAAPTSPMIAVSKTSGLNPAGEDVTVTGAGFLQQAPGVYVVYGPVDTATSWWLDASAFGDAEYVTPTGLGANGTFVKTLTASGTNVGSGNVDCTASGSNCSIATMRAHGSSDRSQDTVTPLTFAAPAAN